MGVDKYAEAPKIADHLAEKIKHNDMPGSYPNFAHRIEALMRQVAGLIPAMAPHAQEVAQVARRYYSATRWRQEPGGHAVLYSTMKTISIQFEPRRRSKRPRLKSDPAPRGRFGIH